MAVFDYKEVIVTDPNTGGQKGRKGSSVGCLDPVSIMRLGEVAAYGAQKYAAHNFMKGYDWLDSYDALHRHLAAFWAGEDYDDESGLLHLASAMWHCHTLISFYERGLGTDNRPPAYKGKPNAEA